MSNKDRSYSAIDDSDNNNSTFSCKVILDSDELPRSNKQWTRAKKCQLTIDSNGLSYTDHFTAFADIEKATIHIYRSPLFLEYSILTIRTGNYCHHFGLKYSDYWKGELPFEIERIYETTPYLLFRQSLIIVILIYIFWQIVKR